MNKHRPGILVSGNGSKSEIPGTFYFYPDTKQGFSRVCSCGKSFYPGFQTRELTTATDWSFQRLADDIIGQGCDFPG